MRRIDISTIDHITKDYPQNLFKGCSRVPKKASAPSDELRDLINDPTIYQPYADYVQYIWNHYEHILLLKPDEFKTYAESFVDRNNNKINIDVSTYNWKKWNKDEKKIKFYEAVIEAMRYEHVRSSKNAYLKYFDKLGIKTCVYCNASYIMNVNTKKRTKSGKVNTVELKGRFELDHFLPKSKYPFLCTSFYNLIPCCPCCNRWKSDSENEDKNNDDQSSTFSLYTNKKEDLNPFTFYLTPYSILKYSLAHNVDDLKIKISSPNDRKLKFNHEKLFHIEDLYEHFKDEAENIIWLYLSRNNDYLKQAFIAFNRVFSNEKILRIMYNLYKGEENIHKKPLSKMKMDILNQLKLLDSFK